ncbi:16895_t:CDS:2, partial [Gigaspora margarita]
EEEVLVNGLDFEQKEKEEIKKNKEVLIITECGVPDYGTEEIKDKIMQAKSVGLAKQDDLTERIIANIKQIEVHSKMEVDINTDNKTEVVDKTSNEIDKVEDISSSIWAQASKSSQNLVELEEWQNILKEVKAELAAARATNFSSNGLHGTNIEVRQAVLAYADDNT